MFTCEIQPVLFSLSFTSIFGQCFLLASQPHHTIDLQKRYVRPVQPRAGRWWLGVRERFNCGLTTKLQCCQWHQSSIHCERSHLASGASKRSWAPMTTCDTPMEVPMQVLSNCQSQCSLNLDFEVAQRILRCSQLQNVAISRKEQRARFLFTRA